jgi:hypothetical protein
MTTSPQANPRSGFAVREWRAYAKNTLVGFLSLELPSGMIIHWLHSS